ncbi:MAG: Nif3-like dinuclear metal center hexameric protein [Clostridiales bacterium]|nr:Nif3-like dinuclear metal center hexameric protein [Clostridiales bacterium]
MRYEALLRCFAEIASGAPEDWDNSGVQIRTDKEEIERVLVCLEVTPAVVEEAKEQEADLILSHHPLIFGGVDHLSADDVHEKMLLDLVTAGIDVFSAHITFDKAPLGNSFFLADLLGLEEIRPVDTADGGDVLPMVTGDVHPAMNLQELFLHTADMMDLTRGQIRAAGDPGMTVLKAAVCTGAGSEFMDEAKTAGCQVLITGDVKYHEAMRAKELGIGVIDAGHYGTEKYFAENFAAQLRDMAGDELDVLESAVNIDPFTFI